MQEGDALVVNETKVFPARVIGVKDKTDAQVELLLLRQLEDTMWEVLVKPARKVRVGNRIQITNDFGCDVIDNTTSGGRVVRFDYNGSDFFEVLGRVGSSPLPLTLNGKLKKSTKNTTKQFTLKNWRCCSSHCRIAFYGRIVR